MPNPSPRIDRVFWLIMAAVLAWGAFHAVGAYLYNHNWQRPAMVLGCVLIFLAWWGWLLRRRNPELGIRNPERRE